MAGGSGFGRRSLLRVATGIAVGGFLGGVTNNALGAVDRGDPQLFVSSEAALLKSYWNFGKPSGAAVEVTQAVAAAAGFSPILQLLPWARAVRFAQQQDAILMAMFRTPERERDFVFSEPLFDDMVVIVTVKGREFPFSGVDDLKGRRCVASPGVVYGVEFEAMRSAIEMDMESDPVQRLRFLVRRDFDCALFNPGRATVRQAAVQAGIDLEMLSILPVPLARLTNHMAIGRSDIGRDLIARLDPAIARLKASGEIARIVARHYD